MSDDSLVTFRELVASKEAKTLEELWQMIDKYVPHLRHSIARSKSWWDQHRDLPEAHMFKSLLFKGMQDIFKIFNDLDVPWLPVVLQRLSDANARAGPIWQDQRLLFEDRQSKCTAILLPVLSLINPRAGTVFAVVPSCIEHGLCGIFTEFYGTPERLLLIGKTTEEAYEVQDRYAHAVAKLLERVGSKHRSRAILCLAKAYGASSMPLLCSSSLAALWELCKSRPYRRVISLIYKWIQPFSEMPAMHHLGCDYVSSLHRFLRPRPNAEKKLFPRFYVSVMMWSTDLYIVALLDEYVAPKSVVAGYVRRQLLHVEEERRIKGIICERQNGRDHGGGLYHISLTHSGLEFDKEDPPLKVAIESGLLLHALFDLNLCHRVKIHMIKHYTEVHEVRAKMKLFFLDQSNSTPPTMELDQRWWDGISPKCLIQDPWMSTELKQRRWLVPLLESWLDDSEHLQSWLDHFEATTRIVNNPLDEDRVFPQCVAIRLMKTTKYMGKFLDDMRERDFEDEPEWLLEECENLRLFKTRMPRFSQAFFYEFSEEEITSRSGQQISSATSKRAGQAYVRSEVRLHSKCGISDVWYTFVDQNKGLYGGDDSENQPLSSFLPQQGIPWMEFPDAWALWGIFRWKGDHSRPQPTKRPSSEIPRAMFTPSVDGSTSQSRGESPVEEDVGEVTMEEDVEDVAVKEDVEGVTVEEGIEEVAVDEDERIAVSAGSRGENSGRGSVDAALVSVDGVIQGGERLGEGVQAEVNNGGSDDQSTIPSFDAAPSEASGKGEAGGGFVREVSVETSYSAAFEWPENPSFIVAMSNALDDAEKQVGWAPEQQQPSPNPAPMDLTDDLSVVVEVARDESDGTGGQDEMEGVEASQSVLVYDSSSDEAAVEEAGEAMEVQDVAPAADARSMAGDSATRSQKGNALQELLRRRREKYAKNRE